MRRDDFDPEEIGHRHFYRLLNSVVVPRPIAWVSTVSEDGELNLAPHSFYTVSCVSPPVVQFTSVGRKDSLVNVEQTGEFVVCLAGEPMFEQINATATRFPGGESEFERVGIETEPSDRVAPPRVAASPVALECTLHSTLSLGDSTVVMGRVVHAAVDSEALADDGLAAIEQLAPLARLGRNQWSTIGEVRAIDRIAYEDWPPDGGASGS